MKDMYTEIDAVTKKVDEVLSTTDRAIEPVRKSISRRFPLFFILLVTFGMSATFFGIERIIMDTPWLSERPVFIFLFGILALMVSGRLYQKLG